MKENSSPPDAARLAALLRPARISPALPPRFQQNVWHRIEATELAVRPESWLDALAALVLRPRLAFAFASVLLVAGVLLGARDGVQAARHDAQMRYVSSVAPHFHP